MATPTNFLNDFMTTIQKVLDERQDMLLKGLSDINTQLTDQIGVLINRCSALETVQLRLFSALAETNPSTHSQIVYELASVLELMKENGHQDLAFADHLRALTGIKAESKPLLRLVPKKPSPPNDVS